MTSWKLVVLLSHDWKLLDDSWKLVVLQSHNWKLVALHMSRVFRAGIRIEMKSRVSSETSIGIRLVLENSCICSAIRLVLENSCICSDESENRDDFCFVF